jgi:hypothetical protein
MLGDLGDRFGNRCLVFVDGTSYLDSEALSADHGLTRVVIVPTSMADGSVTVTDAGPGCGI